MDKSGFINAIREGAIKGYKEFNILPSLTMAQAILESAWWSSELSRKANNLFGVKASEKWTGKKISMKTTEWYRGERQVIDAEFRCYESFDESIEDHSRLLALSRYKAVRECKNYKEACKKIYECGYATDPGYPEKLIRIIEENKLYEFDNINRGQTEGKVIRFQKLCNILGIKDKEGRTLVEDNILGARTLSCIEKMPELKQGSRGEAVKFVQEVLNVLPADGDFGPITKQLVINYQKDRGIEADGIIGPITWASLIAN